MWNKGGKTTFVTLKFYTLYVAHTAMKRQRLTQYGVGIESAFPSGTLFST